MRDQVTTGTPCTGLTAVITHHEDGFRSGVARFNELLADALGVDLLTLSDPAVAAASRPLLSLKFSELEARDETVIASLIARDGWGGSLFLHEFSGGELERCAIEAAKLVFCGNEAVAAAVGPLARECETVWTPGLITDDRVFRPAEISVFSFGMAHKIRTDMFRRLRELLDRSGRSYAVYVSTANHETASLRDAELVFAEMCEIFPDELYFLGNLSDVVVADHLRSSTFFAAFFQDGVRGNNTSVSSAMERGAVVITNLDEYSPSEFRHMENVIDLTRCDELPLDEPDLRVISRNAVNTGRRRSWTRLVEKINQSVDVDRPADAITAVNRFESHCDATAEVVGRARLTSA